jgi:uncharacterized protein YkwD
MGPFLKFFLAAAVCSLAIAISALESRAGEPADEESNALLAAHNRARMAEHKEPLKLSDKLAKAALAHATDMARQKKLDHKGSDKSTAAERVKRAGYLYVHIGENIANGQKTVEQVMESWMKSPGHRANILGEFSEMGAARVEDEDGSSYWCVDFGVPMPRLDPDEAAAAVVKRINDDRVKRKKKPLKSEKKLMRGAAAIAGALAAKERLELQGDPIKLIGEQALEDKDVQLHYSSNVPTAEEIASELLDDEKSQLDGYQEIGVGYALAKNGSPYWCTIVAKARGLRRPGRRPQD